MEITEFKEQHIEDAAKLFQKNYFDIKRKYTYLPDKFEDQDIICSNLQKIISANPAVVAIHSNQIIGYITGYSNIKELKGSSSGSYTPEWGHSVCNNDKDIVYGKLYSEISKIWADNDNFTHIISFLINTELVNTFSMLGFGMQVIDAIRNLDVIKTKTLNDYKIERVNESHISQLKDFDILINKHLESPPIFLKRNHAYNDNVKIINDFLSDKKTTLIATKGKEIISCIRGVKDKGNISILDDHGTFGINFGYTKKEYRDIGIATVLLNEILQIAKDDGANFCSVDFESQNIEGRIFWLKHFKPVVYSMMRKIDDRIKY